MIFELYFFFNWMEWTGEKNISVMIVRRVIYSHGVFINWINMTTIIISESKCLLAHMLCWRETNCPNWIIVNNFFFFFLCATEGQVRHLQMLFNRWSFYLFLYYLLLWIKIVLWFLISFFLNRSPLFFPNIYYLIFIWNKKSDGLTRILRVKKVYLLILISIVFGLIKDGVYQSSKICS